MNREELLNSWLHEEEIAHIKGWDFSHIIERYEEEQDLPWNYRDIINKYRNNDSKILDIDTGGGEFLLSLNHPHCHLSATENYPDNVALCEKELKTLGIDFKRADGSGDLPFEDKSFDIVINRHGDFNVSELYRVLKDGGIFTTEQVGAENDRELVELLLNTKVDLPFPNQYLNIVSESFIKAGLHILEEEEAYRPIKFFDVGALVWFARILEWEFPDFSVLECLDNLYKAQELLEQNGVVEGLIHRYLIVVQK